MQVDLIYTDVFTDDDIVTTTGRWRLYEHTNNEGNSHISLFVECSYGEEEKKEYEPTFFSTYLKIGKGNLVWKKTGKPNVKYIHESYLWIRYSNECGE